MAVGDTFNLDANGMPKEETSMAQPPAQARTPVQASTKPVPLPRRTDRRPPRVIVPDRTKRVSGMGGVRQLTGGMTTNNPQWDTWVEKYSQKYDIDPNLIVMQMFKESSFDPEARSPAKGKGLMQLTPIAEKELANNKLFTPTNIFDPEQNIHGGIAFLSHMLKKFKGDVGAAVLAYNQGETSVRKHGGKPWTAIGRDYVDKIYNRWQNHNRQGFKPNRLAQVPPTSTPAAPAQPTAPPSGMMDRAKGFWNTYISPYLPTIF